MSNTSAPEHPVAVALVGMSGRFPGASGVAAFWNNLCQGQIAIRTFSDEELIAAGVDRETLRQPNYVKAGTVVEDIDRFDASFFGYSAREAELMDPQHRLFLEIVWEALEDAGYNPETFRGPIGVFAGSAPSSYREHNLNSRPELTATAGYLQIATGNDHDSLASTVSYKLNLRGPSIAVQTACSTSLVAVHLACQSLLVYESDMVVAGGVAIACPQGTGYLYQEGDILSPDGRCRTFDAGAQGSVMGSGVGVVVLKRLEDALDDGDHIYAIIRGSAVNNDGIRRVGYTAPGMLGQAAVMTRALHNADVMPETISYVECHGTATQLGDSIELAAMIRAYRRGTDHTRFCAIGSVKPNVGHLDRASGVTGLIKTALALHHKQIPPSLNFERPSPDIDLDNSPFFVNTSLRAWEANGTPRRAGVSSFGLGGTNAHVLLEEPPAPRAGAPTRSQQLLVLSAKTDTALEQATDRLLDHLEANPRLNLADVAYTLQVGRAAFNHRRALVCTSVADAVRALRERDPQRVRGCQQIYRDRPVALLLPGAASYPAELVRQLYADEPDFRAAFDLGCDRLAQLTGADLRRALLSTPAAPAGTLPAAQQRPLALLVEYALAQALIGCGFQPESLIGCGQGEYVAACLAGVLTLEDMLALAVRTAALLAEADLGATADAAWPALPQPSIDVLAGWLAGLTLRSPRLPLVSATTGAWLVEQQALDPTHWVAWLCRPPRYDAALNALWEEPGRLVLAIGHAGPAAPLLALQPERALAFPPAANDRPYAQEQLLNTVGQLWLAGVQISWDQRRDSRSRRRVSLPTYPFERQRYWIDARPSGPSPEPPAAAPGKWPQIGRWFSTPVWKQTAPLSLPDRAAAARQHGPWLLLADDGGLADRLAETLTRLGTTVVLVKAGLRYARHSAAAYTIDPGAPDDYQRLLAGLEQPPKTVLHLGSLSATPPTPDPAARFAQAQRHGFYSLVYLARALGGRLLDDDLALWIISPHSYRVTGGEDLRPEHATLAGARLVIAQEYLNISCRQIDIDRPAPGSWQEQRLLDALLAECAIGATDHHIAAYRSGERWMQLYEPLALAAPTPGTALRQRGVYLITGGLGNIGMVLAEHLARGFQARVALSTRSAFPAAETWPDWLAHHPHDHPAYQKIKQLQALRECGAEVLVLQADAADAGQVRQALATVKQRFGALHGVFHAAGSSDVAGFAAIQAIEPAGCDLHFGPKVRGVYVLEELLADQPLDFCVLFSSLASVLGGLAFVGYSAANSFLDAFAQYRAQRSPQRWISVNWDTWLVKDNPHGDMGGTVMEYAMQRDEALRALEHIVAVDAPPAQIVLSTGSLQARLDQWVRLITRRDADHAGATVHPRPELMTPYVAPAGEIEQKVASIWEAVLGVQVGTLDNFLELGGNSLIGTQVITRLRRAFQIDVPLTLIFDAPTVEQMAIAVELLLIEAIERTDSRRS